MAKLTFQDLTFQEEDSELKIVFLNIFNTEISKKDLKKISNFTISKDKHTIEFKDANENKAQTQFNFLLEKAFNNLTNSITKKRAIYIHQNSGIPLIGNVSFGIVDRNSNLIEIKPITSCNIDCIYCSVDQFRRSADFVIEDEYMVSELKELIKYKECDDIEVHIGTQGEPLLYTQLTNLIKSISKIKEVKRISMDTNGIMITNTKADELIDAGLTQFNLSINALDTRRATYVITHYSDYDLNGTEQEVSGVSLSNIQIIKS